MTINTSTSSPAGGVRPVYQSQAGAPNEVDPNYSGQSQTGGTTAVDSNLNGAKKTGDASLNAAVSASQITEVELQRLFTDIAGDDGILTQDEYKTFLKAKNPALSDAEIQAKVDALFKNADTDGSNTLTYAEFAGKQN